MAKFAYLFPGQGVQYVGMGKGLYENFTKAREVFDEVNDVLDFDLKTLCFEGPQEELSKTQNCQVAVLTASLASLRVFEELYGSNISKPSFNAGLSLGEYSALVASGVLELRDAAILVRKRGIYMAAASEKTPGQMLVIIGLQLENVKQICKATNTQIANLNSPGQIVISGKISDIERAAELSKQQKARKTLVLDVSGAFHSSIMDEASDQLKTYIDKVNFSNATVPVVANFSAEPLTDAESIKDNLIKQVNNTTKWEKSIRYMIENGITNFMEIGPGNVLKGLMRKIDSGSTVYSVSCDENVRECVNGWIANL